MTSSIITIRINLTSNFFKDFYMFVNQIFLSLKVVLCYEKYLKQSFFELYKMIFIGCADCQVLKYIKSFVFHLSFCYLIFLNRNRYRYKINNTIFSMHFSVGRLNKSKYLTVFQSSTFVYNETVITALWLQ